LDLEEARRWALRRLTDGHRTTLGARPRRRRGQHHL